jgi:hypothetical protein
MIQEHMDLLFTVIWSFALANIMGAALCLALCAPLARLTAIRFDYLAPGIFIIMLFGAFQSTRHMGDLAVMLLLGLLGWGMKRMGWPRPPFLIAFVLSTPTERYLWISVNRYGADWLTRPGALAILAVLLASLAYWFLSRKRTAPAERQAPAPADWRFRPAAAFSLGIAVVLALAAWGALSFPFYAALLPMVVGVPGLVMAGTQFVLDLRGGGRKGEALDLATSQAAASRAGTLRALGVLAIMVAYYALILAVGFRAATLVFLVTFLRTLPRASWGRTAIYTVAVFAVVEAFSRILNMEMPEGYWHIGP